MMKDTEEMLSAVSRTAEMGKITLEQLEKITKEKSFRRVMRIQYKAYDILMNETEIQYAATGLAPERESRKTKMMTHMGIKMETWKDKSDTHLAEMLIEGTNQGIMELTEVLHKCKETETETRKLAERAVQLLERNVEELKQFL